MNKYQKEVIQLKNQRDKSIIGEIQLIFDEIRDKAQKQAMTVTGKAGDNKEYFQEQNRAEKFAIDLNKDLKPQYVKKDDFIKGWYAEEYRTTYFQSLYTVVNKGIADGYTLKLPRYTKKQFEKAINYPLSKLINKTAMQSARNIDVNQLYTIIVSGVEEGLSLPNINKKIDIALGYRDSVTGKIIDHIDPKTGEKLYKGQQYKTMRILRTEVSRMRATAETDQWINQQPIVESKMQLQSVLDNRTRKQSVQVDGRYANEEGKFLYPNDEYYYAKRTGVARWDINDREQVLTLDPEYKPSQKSQRNLKTGKSELQPYQTFEEYAKTQNLVKNKYGEYLFK